MAKRKRRPIIISNEIEEEKKQEEVIEEEEKIDEPIKEVKEDVPKEDNYANVKIDNRDKIVFKFKCDSADYKPLKATPGSSAYDIKARIKDAQIKLYNVINATNGTSNKMANIIMLQNTPTLVLNPGDRVKIPTGLRADIPEGWEIGIYPRSGLSLKKGLLIVNTPATIDSDYILEIHVIVQNIGERPIKIKDGDRIAQIKFLPVMNANIEFVDNIDKETERKGGFGSTGA